LLYSPDRTGPLRRQDRKALVLRPADLGGVRTARYNVHGL